MAFQKIQRIVCPTCKWGITYKTAPPVLCTGCGAALPQATQKGKGRSKSVSVMQQTYSPPTPPSLSLVHPPPPPVGARWPTAAQQLQQQQLQFQQHMLAQQQQFQQQLQQFTTSLNTPQRPRKDASPSKPGVSRGRPNPGSSSPTVNPSPTTQAPQMPPMPKALLHTKQALAAARAEGDAATISSSRQFNSPCRRSGSRASLHHNASSTSRL